MTTTRDAWTAVRGSPFDFLRSRWPWASLAYLASTVPLGLICLLSGLTLLAVGVTTMVLVVGFIVLAVLPRLVGAVTVAERARLRMVLPTAEVVAGSAFKERLRARRTLPVTWPEVGYVGLLVMLLWAIDAAVLAFAVGVPATLLLAPLLVQLGPVEVIGVRVADLEGATLAVGLGLVSSVVSAYLVTALACGQAALTRLLLDPPAAKLAEAVAALRRSRVDLVRAFESERRRIERDLHDGVQQRLVALTITLGRAELDGGPGSGSKLVRVAREQAEAALEDLRFTIRGIYPRVLTDHGLAAAIHDIADRSPVPVDTHVMLDRRLPGPIEAAAYFVASEALTNVARHASARSIQVHVWTDGPRLLLTVVDDGVGGADIEGGSGLAGLVSRLEVHDGSLHVHSPPGGPTEVRMECPIHVD